MLTPKRLPLPQLSGDWKVDGPALLRALSDYFLLLETKGSLTITEATIDSSTIGATSATTGKFTTVQSTVATGTAPLVVASTTKVTNLNVDQVDGGDWAAPGTIGSGTPNTGAFTTLSASGLISANGGQVAFPATQSASADANTLDDYEEGTWTPGISFGGGTTGITYNGATSGSYTKIGNRVFFCGLLVLTNKGSSAGAALITGLPFAAANNNNNWSPVSLYPAVAVTYANMMIARCEINTTTITLSEVTEAGAVSALADTDFANTSQLMFSGHYRV